MPAQRVTGASATRATTIIQEEGGSRHRYLPEKELIVRIGRCMTEKPAWVSAPVFLFKQCLWMRSA